MARVRTRVEGAKGVLRDLYDTNVPKSIRTNQFMKLLKNAGNVAAIDWQVSVLPKKFKQPAAAEYKMQTRKPRTMKRKRGFARVSGVNSRIYLVWSGDTQESTARRGRVSSTGAETGIKTRLTLTVPRYIVKHKHYGGLMWDELTRLSTKDAERYAEVFFGVVSLGL